jgi:hypothetical protein
MRRFLALTGASIVFFAGASSAATPTGSLRVFNDSPAAFTYVVNGGSEKTIKSGGYFGETVSVGQNRFKVTGRGFARTETVSLDTSNAHDNGQGPGSLRWCLSVTAQGSKLMTPQACFKRIMSY